MKRLHIGPLSIYIDPRDIWVGIYIAKPAVYVCPLPMLVIKWNKRTTGYLAASPE